MRRWRRSRPGRLGWRCLLRMQRGFRVLRSWFLLSATGLEQGRSRRSLPDFWLLLRDRRRVHPTHLPVVPVEVIEAPAVHEAVVLRLGRALAAPRAPAVAQLLHLRT